MWIWVVVAFVVGVVVGWLIAQYLSKEKLADCEGRVVDLQHKLGQKEKQAQSLQASVDEGTQRIKDLEAALEAAKEAPAPPIRRDNLKRVEGIGPKIESVLQGEGILTYAQLAFAKISDLEAILTKADLRLADPTTWPEQARLAAAGEWDALQKLQDRLSGGRVE